MKTLLLILLLSGNAVYAQMHISTNHRKDYAWDEAQEKWVLTSDDESVHTLFDFNKELTMFKHTTATITSAYYIKTSSEDKTKKIWEFDVVSDVGNKYHIILDPDNNNIRFVGKTKEGGTYLVRHTIKSIWYDE